MRGILVIRRFFNLSVNYLVRNGVEFLTLRETSRFWIIKRFPAKSRRCLFSAKCHNIIVFD